MPDHTGTAIIAITEQGAPLAARLAAKLPGAKLVLADTLRSIGGDATGYYHGPAGEQVRGWFAKYRQIIFHGSLGEVVRLIAPHLASRQADPALLVIDDAGRFVVSLLPGRAGDAYAELVAEAIGAVPVVTTAAGAGNAFSVERLGRELGWQIDPTCQGNIAHVSAAVAHFEPVALVQECGEKNRGSQGVPLPKNLTIYDSLEQVPTDVRAILWVTDRLVDAATWAAIGSKTVIYRPKSLVLGLGCDEGTSRETVLEAISKALEDNQLDLSCVRGIATIDKKQNEPGMVALAAEMGWQFVTYPAAELAAVPNIPNPSEVVLKYMGTPAVGEPAAMLSAGVGVDGLVVEKVTYQGADELNATVCVARAGFSKNFVAGG